MMIYKTLGKNTTGQTLVGCPHVSELGSIEMHLYPDGSAVYRIQGHSWTYFKPSKQTIVLWCYQCYQGLAPMDCQVIREVNLPGSPRC